MRLRVLGLALAVAVFGAALAAVAEEPVDLKVVHRVKDEAFRNSQVMDHLFYLTDVNGPRLTASPGWRSAADWAMARLKGWGVAEARLEKWGRFGRGWSLQRFSAHLLAPAYAPLHGVPKAWTAGTGGEVTGDVVFAPLFAEKQTGEIFDLELLAKGIEDYAANQKGKLRGKVVLIEPSMRLDLPTKPEVERYDDAKLGILAQGPEPEAVPPLEWPLMRLPADREEREQVTASIPLEVSADFFVRRRRIVDRLSAFLRDEGVLAAFAADKRGSGGTVFAEGVRSGDPEAPVSPPIVVLAPESYARLVRLVDRKVPVRVALDVEVKFHDEAQDGFNVIAEIPGGRKKDEVVMLGAHLDSWHAGTGATDNAAGCAVVLEAMRILKALDLKMDRTVRLALWSGEEQGLLGSRGYVREHFGDPVTMALKPEHARLAAYFNLDNGSGRVRGVYLQGNDMARPIFEAWLAPFKDLGATTLALADTGGTDHKSFDAVGLPGFQFIQDPLDYMTRTHHSELDVYDHAVPADLMQASAVMASFVYHAATRPEMLPRKTLPRPLPKQQPGGSPTAGR
jgi:carboxypeptidase Q